GARRLCARKGPLQSGRGEGRRADRPGRQDEDRGGRLCARLRRGAGDGRCHLYHPQPEQRRDGAACVDRALAGRRHACPPRRLSDGRLRPVAARRGAGRGEGQGADRVALRRRRVRIEAGDRPRKRRRRGRREEARPAREGCDGAPAGVRRHGPPIEHRTAHPAGRGPGRPPHRD
ncbi:hypothetical protein LTR94_032211, partial [Friedmanniomyces endolithicus]